MPISCVYLLYNVEGYYYIGQTTNLSRRLSQHKYPGPCSSKNLGPYWDCEVLEECAKNDLRKAERYYYDFFFEISPEHSINAAKPMRTKLEWEHDNPEKKKQKAARHSKKNAAKITQKTLQWRTDNPDKYAEQRERYRERHNENCKRYLAKKRLQNVN